MLPDAHCIGLLFFASKRRNVTEPRDWWGLWSLAGRDPCAIRRAIRPCPIPCHLTPWPGHRTTTRFKRQPAAPIRAHHSIAKDSGQCRKRRTADSARDLGPRTRHERASNVQLRGPRFQRTQRAWTHRCVDDSNECGRPIAAATKAHLLSRVCVCL